MRRQRNSRTTAGASGFARLVASVLLLSCGLVSCGERSPRAQSRVYEAGEKATAGPLTYTVIDTRILPRLGDDPATARMPQTRFYLVQVSILNSGSSEVPIPAMMLVDDSGKTWNELADGSGVPNWLGIVRKLKPNQTEQGNVAFDAPAKHYRLRLTDDTDDADIAIDLPLTFVHEQLEESDLPVPGAPAPPKR